jgi:chemotaxis signal transduction protein
MVVFQAGSEQPKAVPLSLVTRLEELDATSFEQGDGRTLVQYRGELMPIVAADPNAPIATTGVQPVLVFTYNGLAAGMAVDKIVDIVEEALDIELAAERSGLLGVAVLKGKATEVLDVSHYLSLALTNWDDPGTNKPAKHIVLVERNPFFRNLLSPLLRSAGYEVEAVDTVSAALVCAEYRKPSAVLTDIDVDVASARRLLSDDRLVGTSIVALSGSPDADATGFASLSDCRCRKRRQIGDCSMNALATRHESELALAKAGTKEFVTVNVADQLFGVEVIDIQDVFSLKGLTPVPGARAEIAGVLNLRGRIVTAIDARCRLGLPTRPQGFAGMMAVGVEYQGEAYGILVDSVGEVLRLSDSEFEPNPVNLNPNWKDVSQGVYRLEGRLLMTLNIDQLLCVATA